MLSSRAEAIRNLYVCVHQVTFTSSSVEKWRVEMILMANKKSGNLVSWILFGWELY